MESPVIRVVLADDHPVVRGGIRDALNKDAGIEVVGEASNGEEAIALVQREKPAVALFDIKMPPSNGIAAMKQVLKECPDTRVIILTVYDSDAYWDAARQAGASGYLLKNASSEQLRAAVRAVASGNTVFSGELARRSAQREAGHITVGDRVIDALTANELETLRLVGKGYEDSEIAEELAVGDRAVQSRLRVIFDKLGVKNRIQALVLALREGWIDLDADEVLLPGKSKRGD